MNADNPTFKADALRSLLQRLAEPDLTLADSRRLLAQLDLLVDGGMPQPVPTSSPVAAPFQVDDRAPCPPVACRLLSA